MPNNPTWEETEEIDSGPSWDETSPESVSIPKPKPWELTAEGQRPDIGPWTQGPQQREEALAIYESMLQPPVTIPEFKGTTPVGKVAAGLGNVAGGLYNMAASPVGLVTLPLAATPIGGPVIGGVFGGLAAKRAGETLGEASVTGDLQKYVEGGAEALLAPAMAHPRFARVELPPTIIPPIIKPVLGSENIRFRMEGTEDLSRRPLKAPKPVVPETVEELPPTVPETVPIQPEIATWEDAVTELKTRGTGTETKAQIQGMFPQLNLSKESAGGLAKDAWGENWKPAQQTRQPAPEIKAIAAETKVEPETVEKGVRVEANDHPEVAKSNPELLPTLVKDELTLDKKAYDKDVDPRKQELIEVAESPKGIDAERQQIIRLLERLEEPSPTGSELWSKEGKEETVKKLRSRLAEIERSKFPEKPTPPPPEAQAKPAAAPTEAKTEVSEGKAAEEKPWWKQAQEKVEGKESWQVTKQDYSDAAASRVSGQSVRKTRKLAELVHKGFVRDAIKAGKPVPAEVLADYPDLAPKQPWEMTRSDYVRSMRESEGIPSVRGSKTDRAMIASYETNHAASVADAVNSGKPVPAEVLKDYPDLAPKPIETRSRDLPLWSELQAGTREFNNRRTTKARKQEIISRQIELRKQLLEKGYNPDQIKAVEMLQAEAPISPKQPSHQPIAGIEVKKQGAEGKIAEPNEITSSEKQIADVGIPERVPPIITTPAETKAWLSGIKAAYGRGTDEARRAIDGLKEFAKSRKYWDSSSRAAGNIARSLGVDISHRTSDTSRIQLGANVIRLANQESLFHEVGHAILLQKSGGIPWEKMGDVRGEWKALHDADWAGVARDKWDYWTTQTERYASLLNLYVKHNAKFQKLAPELYSKLERLLDESAPTIALFQEARKRGVSPQVLLNEKLSQLRKTQPPAPGPGAQTVGEPQKAQIEQLTDAFKGIEAEKTPLKEQVKEAFAIGEKFSGTKDLFSRALSGLKSSGDWFIQKWKAIPDIDNLLRAKGDLSAQLQANSWRTQKWIKQALKAVPRKRDQAAIAKWIDAGGDRAELERGMAETLPQYKQAYEDALNLKGDLLIAAQNAQNYFEARLQEAVDAGVLKDGVEDYIHRIYESRPDVAEKAVAHVQDGILKANPALAKKRVFQFDWEAEKLGYKPVQSFITRLAVYESSLAKALAAREFIRKATTMKAADGRPIVDVKGVGIPLEDAATGERTGTLIKPQFNPAKANVEGTANYRGDYVNKEFPALSKWKWVSEDAAGKPILVQGDVAIHPDYVHRINALLEPSRVRYGRYGKVLRPAMAISSTVKQTMLDLSMFHQVQITVHGLEHKVLPWKILNDIDLNNPNVQGLLKGGISLGGEYSPYHAEGLVGSSLTRHIPFLGPLTQAYHDWLFQSYIPRIKMTMALSALERNRARYKGELTEEQILHKTARQANSAFGELNYIMLERSKTAQDISRLIMLAPDFLEARGRFAAEALTKGGKSTVPGFGNEQRAALLLGALTLYITARMANKMINDQYHFEPENAFSIVKDGHAYSLRTVQGDILHLLAKPLQFWMNRLNPVYGRTLLQIATGRDYFGRKRSVPETLWDSVANTVPIALRSSRERALWESIANSMGVQAKRWSDVDDAFTLAKKWKDAHGIGEKGEFIYDPDKDPLRPLKIALSHGDDVGAAKEIGKLTEGGTKIKKLNDYFDRYASMPFTGSAANDRKWQKELSEDEKKTVLAAREHKKSIKQLYLKARGQYFAAKNTPQ